jgi:hypothetical protein
MTAASTQPHNSLWLFGVVVLPYGFTIAVTVLLMPYLLRKYGMPVDRIAEISAIAILPAIWSFLWSPLADTRCTRHSCSTSSGSASTRRRSLIPRSTRQHLLIGERNIAEYLNRAGAHGVAIIQHRHLSRFDHGSVSFRDEPCASIEPAGSRVDLIGDFVDREPQPRRDFGNRLAAEIILDISDEHPPACRLEGRHFIPPLASRFHRPPSLLESSRGDSLEVHLMPADHK